MFKNYILIAWRNLSRHKTSAIINISGLTIGMSVAIMIGLWVWDEVSYDTNFKNFDTIGLVYSSSSYKGKYLCNEIVSRPLEFELRNKYGSSFKHIVMSRWTEDRVLTSGDKKLTISGRFMQAEAPDMLSLEMIAGNRNALNDPSSIIISESTAEKFFGKGDAIGKAIKIDNTMNVKVAGIYPDFPSNCKFANVNFIAPWDLLMANTPWMEEAKDNWTNESFKIYVQIQPNTTFEAVSARIKLAIYNNIDPEDRKFNQQVFLHPMRRWHLYSEWKNGVNTGAQAHLVWLFGTIGAFVLILACINFINLSTARSEKRAKEVGVRKAIGSGRSALIKQFLSESFLIVLIAFVFALILVIITLPWFNDIADKRMAIQWTDPVFWLSCVAFISFTGFLAGSYPAFYLSSFNVVKVLKGNLHGASSSAVPRKVLVVLQFAVSVTLIAGTLIVYRQIQHAKRRPLGYEKSGLIGFHVKSPELIWKQKILIHELKKAGIAEEAALSNGPVTDTWSNSSNFDWEGKTANQFESFGIFWVTHDYGKTIGWQLKEGRDFSREVSRDSSTHSSPEGSLVTYNIIINETAVKYMNLKKPVGSIIRTGSQPLRIIGVVKDQLTDSPYEKIKQNIYAVNYDEATSWLYLHLNPKINIKDALKQMEQIFQRIVPSAPFDYRFTDTEYSKKFEEEERIGKLSTIFASLAIFISCLGLFGLASFVAEQRTKEFGIRKVLGANTFDLWKRMSVSFVVLVTISCFIAIPAAWYFLQQWLMKYEYRTEISIWIFVVACGGALAITIITVSIQAIKVAGTDPVKSLKVE